MDTDGPSIGYYTHTTGPNSLTWTREAGATSLAQGGTHDGPRSTLREEFGEDPGRHRYRAAGR
ncbi:MAG TPA: hypothetical protein VFV73_17565, partial [Streptosporangiaceae bacterium]|nr:hypothetical protein [Streptosporangiaceae bacterium]